MPRDFGIKEVRARLCFNSRGEPTIETEVKVGSTFGRASAPAGASVGKFEAQTFPKGGVKEALHLLAEYKAHLVGIDASDPYALTERLRSIDGRQSYQRIGGSAAFALTMAAAEAAANAKGVPLYRLLAPKAQTCIPYPIGNVLGGGMHAGKATPDIQEFLVCAKGAKNIVQALEANAAVHRELGVRLGKMDPEFTRGKGDEGAWAPRLKNEQALELVDSATCSVSDSLGVEIRVGLDIASSSFWNEKTKVYDYSRSGVRLTPGEQVDYVCGLVKDYRLIYVEDPLQEADFEGFAELTRKVRGAYVVGDDLLVTNPRRLEKAVNLGACNAAILKVNQAGGLGDALRFAEAAAKAKYAIITSHRSGDTPDAHIAHVAVATGSKMLKSGVVGGERVAKLNELIRISEMNAGIRVASLDF